MKQWFVGFSMVFMVFGVSAETLSLNYEGFYDRMKVVKDDDYSLVDMQFTLVEERTGVPCPVVEGVLLTESTEQNILIKDDTKQIFLPFDKTLDSDKAILTFNIPGATRCTLSMQVVSSMTLLSHFEVSKLNDVRYQFEALYDDLAGFFVSWLLPDIKGVIFDFAKATTVSDSLLNNPAISCELTRCFVDLSVGSQLPDTIEFSSSPTVLRPWIAK